MSFIYILVIFHNFLRIQKSLQYNFSTNDCTINFQKTGMHLNEIADIKKLLSDFDETNCTSVKFCPVNKILVAEDRL